MLGFEQGGELGELGGVAAVQDHVDARGGKFVRPAQAESVGGAGDEGPGLRGLGGARSGVVGAIFRELGGVDEVEVGDFVELPGERSEGGIVGDVIRTWSTKPMLAIVTVQTALHAPLARCFSAYILERQY
jgi:hypothetical protein